MGTNFRTSLSGTAFTVVEGLAKLAHDKIVACWSGERFAPKSLHIHGNNVVVRLWIFIVKSGVIRAPVQSSTQGVR